MGEPKQTWTLEELRQACMAYDSDKGTWQESRLQGRAVFEALLGRDLTDDEGETWDRETGNEW